MATSARIRRAQPLLGTFVEIAASGDAACDLNEAVDAAFAVIAQTHRLMSFHDAQSDLSRINREAFAGAVLVHPWTYQVLQTALEFYRRSGGRFDVTVAPLLQAGGLLPRDMESAGVTNEDVIGANAVELLDGCAVRFHRRGLRIDLGGIAKGFAVDRAIGVLRERGTTSGLVNAGGDLAVLGSTPERVDIRRPQNPRELLCAVRIANAALASSGRVFELLHQAETGETAVFDPNRRKPVGAVAGASVRAASCMVADALTKVVMIAGQAATPLLQHYRASALLVLESGEVLVTPDWQDGIRQDGTSFTA